MPFPATRVWTTGEVLSASNLNTFVSDPIDYAAGRGGEPTEHENSLLVENGANGDRFVGLPAGTTTQRPTPSQPAIRFNTTDDVIDLYDGSDWTQVLDAGAVTFANLLSNGGIGDDEDQAARGNHTHSLSLLNSAMVDISTSSQVYVADSDAEAIYRRTGDSWEEVVAFPAQATAAEGVAVRPNGNVLLARTDSPTGIYEWNGTSWGARIDTPGAIQSRGLAVDGSGNILWLNGARQLYLRSGGAWGTAISCALNTGQFTGVAVASNGDYLTVHQQTRQVHRRSGGAWTLVTTAPTAIAEGARGIAIDIEERIYVLDGANDDYYVFENDAWSSAISLPGAFTSPSGMSIHELTEDVVVMSGTVTAGGSVNIEVALTYDAVDSTITVEVGGSTVTPQNTITSNNELARMYSYRANLDSGDDYSVSATNSGVGGLVAIAFLNEAAEI